MNSSPPRRSDRLQGPPDEGGIEVFIKVSFFIGFVMFEVRGRKNGLREEEGRKARRVRPREDH